MNSMTRYEITVTRMSLRVAWYVVNAVVFVLFFFVLPRTWEMFGVYLGVLLVLHLLLRRVVFYVSAVGRRQRLENEL